MARKKTARPEIKSEIAEEVQSKAKPEPPVVVMDIANQLNVAPSVLWDYAQEDSQKGNDEGNPYGTSFGFEGRLLYALVRALKPNHILEIGTHHGGGTNHLAAAVVRNGSGKVTTIDISPHSGQHFLMGNRPVIQHIVADANLYIPQTGEVFDFIFEDGNHSEFQVHVIYQNLSRILAPGGLIISHDALVEGMGEYVRNGITKSGIPLEQVRFYDTSPVGLSIYRRPE